MFYPAGPGRQEEGRSPGTTIADKNELRHPPAVKPGVAWLAAGCPDHLWALGPARASRQKAIHRRLRPGHGGHHRLGDRRPQPVGRRHHRLVVRLERFRGLRAPRRQTLRKEGPWWGHLYRRTSMMDMICYVAENLLIGAALFIGLRT